MRINNIDICMLYKNNKQQGLTIQIQKSGNMQRLFILPTGQFLSNYFVQIYRLKHTCNHYVCDFFGCDFGKRINFKSLFLARVALVFEIQNDFWVSSRVDLLSSAAETYFHSHPPQSLPRPNIQFPPALFSSFSLLVHTKDSPATRNEFKTTNSIRSDTLDRRECPFFF